jgi:phosphatidylglycerol:prolipoprotein diacylglycerol transferase
MSYHGGLVGLVAGTLLYARYKKIDYLEWADMIVAAVPFGYVFGRLGNFINAELYGRVTTQPWGMLFQSAGTFPAKEQWVQEAAKATGVNIPNMNVMVNLPRHPSQLYEACLEGIVLGLIMWFWARKYHPFKGFSVGIYLIGYGAFRFFLEYFRAPDDWMGYILNFSGQQDLPLYIYKTPWAFSMGQILCFLMVASGIIMLIALKPRDERKNGAPVMEKSKNSARNLRKKLK